VKIPFNLLVAKQCLFGRGIEMDVKCIASFIRFASRVQRLMNISHNVSDKHETFLDSSRITSKIAIHSTHHAVGVIQNVNQSKKRKLKCLESGGESQEGRTQHKT
jgi:hypothetical protein